MRPVMYSGFCISIEQKSLYKSSPNISLSYRMLSRVGTVSGSISWCFFYSASKFVHFADLIYDEAKGGNNTDPDEDDEL